MSVRSVGATPTKGEEILAVWYTISWQDKVEDGQRSDTLYQCPLCGIAYDIDMNLSGEGFTPQITYQVTDNCNCHDEAVGG